jgi:hypothetical protein
MAGSGLFPIKPASPSGADFLPVLILFPFIQPALIVLSYQAQHAADFLALDFRVYLSPLFVEDLAHDRLPVLREMDGSDQICYLGIDDLGVNPLPDEGTT